MFPHWITTDNYAAYFAGKIVPTFVRMTALKKFWQHKQSHLLSFFLSLGLFQSKIETTCQRYKFPIFQLVKQLSLDASIDGSWQLSFIWYPRVTVVLANEKTFRVCSPKQRNYRPRYMLIALEWKCIFDLNSPWSIFQDCIVVISRKLTAHFFISERATKKINIVDNPC